MIIYINERCFHFCHYYLLLCRYFFIVFLPNCFIGFFMSLLFRINKPNGGENENSMATGPPADYLSLSLSLSLFIAISCTSFSLYTFCALLALSLSLILNDNDFDSRRNHFTLYSKRKLIFPQNRHLIHKFFYDKFPNWIDFLYLSPMNEIRVDFLRNEQTNEWEQTSTEGVWDRNRVQIQQSAQRLRSPTHNNNNNDNG